MSGRITRLLDLGKELIILLLHEITCLYDEAMSTNGTALVNGGKHALASLHLSDYNISERTGFIPELPPLSRLTNQVFSRWEELMDQLPDLIKERKLRDRIDSLPEVEFSEKTLHSDREWQRAYVVLTFLSQGYIWMEGEDGLVNRLPKKLAVPWCSVAEHVSLQPVITYASTVLYNYKLIEPKGPLGENNIQAIATFTGTEDESWFYIGAIFVETAAVPGLKAMQRIFSAMPVNDYESISEDLGIVAESLYNMKTGLNRMYERCDPKVFYVDIRPFQAGSKGLEAFPEGIIYEGVESPLRQYHGASAAQNSAIHAYDIFLGIQHTGSDLEFLETMQHYMPRRHREFLDVLASQPSVHDYAARSQDRQLIKRYNEAVEAFGDFRSNHIVLVTRYIVAQKKYSVNASLDEKGTGGTPFMTFLKQVRDDTVALLIDT